MSAQDAKRGPGTGPVAIDPYEEATTDHGTASVIKLEGFERRHRWRDGQDTTAPKHGWTAAYKAGRERVLGHDRWAS